MTARLIPTASEEEWLAARRAGVTASEIAVLMGLSPWSSPFELYHRKIGNLPEQPDHAALERGRVLEPYIARKFAELRPEFHVDGNGRELFAHPERPWQLATPDRVLSDDVCHCGATDDVVCVCITDHEPIAVLETKTDASPGGEWGEDGSDQIPVHYRCQVLWQMDVLGVAAAYVACLFVQRWEVRVYELAMDPAALQDLSIMRGEAIGFLNRIQLGKPPEVDWRPATAAALRHLHPSVEDREVNIGKQLAGWYAAACRDLKAAERRKTLHENRIRVALGSARYATAYGKTVARRDVYPVKEHVRKATTVDRLVAVTPKEPKK